MNDLIKELTQNDDKQAYKRLMEIVDESKLSNKYYQYLNDFLLLIINENSYIRTRGFILCCSQAKWDDGKINEILPSMLKLFNDPKPTVIRQCLKAIKDVIIYCPKYCEEILKTIIMIDLTNYKDTMAPLIKKDINNLKELIIDVKTNNDIK